MRTLSFFLIVLSCVIPLSAQAGDGSLAAPDAAAAARARMTNRRAAPHALPPQPKSALSKTEIPPDAPVVTLESVCDGPRKTAKSAHCKTVITRAELDGLVDALMPEASQVVRAQFAINYARMLAAAEVAKRRHLEENAAVAKAIRSQEKMARIQVLSSSLYKMFQTQANMISPTDIQNYYSSHAHDFEEVELQRLFLPKSAVSSGTKPIDLAAARTLLESMRARAVAGEDLKQLEQETYTKLDLQNSPPADNRVVVRWNNLPAEQARAINESSGDVSQVVDSPGAFFILKVVSKRSIALKDALPEIEAALRQQSLQKSLREAAQSVKAEFNLQFFDLPSVPDLFPPPGVGQLTARPKMTSNTHPRGFPRAGAPRTALSLQH